ncbi:MAG: RNA polymerase factor sigma-54 [Peptococcia bacterium]|jgi:RNA polymerase sigma-54 factor
MKLDYGLKLEQSQKLMITPELRQALQILQFSSLELAQYVNQILSENPLLEIKEEEKKENEITWEDYFHEMQKQPDYTGSQEVKEEFPLENIVVRDLNLQDYLLSQLGYLSLTPLEQKIGRYLIGNVNSAGYLTISVEQSAHDLQVRKEQVEKILRFIQNFEPAGVGARNLRECLLLQLKQKNIQEQDLRRVIENHLEDLGAGKFMKVAETMNLSVLRIQELADFIKTLNPKPGASFSNGEQICYIIPDIFVERVEGEYIILLNDYLVPRLMINQTYRSVFREDNEVDKKTRGFVENKLNQALWVMRSMEQRRKTLYQIAEVLLKKQREFFDKGIKYLRPLTLKQVAVEMDVHESTVSRATTNKYMQTAHGIFELKFFFSPGLKMSTGKSMSTESIKRMLQEIIKNEDSAKPYSDQKLAELLQEKGVCIARRTITKYRHELGILSKAQRRRFE